MTTAELITQINLMMGESYDDSLLSDYITLAQKECLRWEYQLIGEPETPDYTVYDNVVIGAVICGMSIRGAENETQHSENGILRGFHHTDMSDYIRNHITPFARPS